MTISPALRGIIRAPHRLGGVAKSCSLFVATPSGPLTVSRAWQELLLIRRNALRPAHRLAGVARVAPYSSQRHPSSFGSSRSRDFAELNLHLALFEELGKNDFLSTMPED
jgi:hypothetical protein